MASDRYGVILDAGSSGTRIYIYRWEDPATAASKASPEALRGLPEIKTKKKWTKKIHPGVSTFHDKPHDVGPDHLAPLFEHAIDVIPKSSIAQTPVFLLATAGVRLLPADERRALLDEICTFARRSTEFLLPDCDTHIRVIPGETEGLYGWIATNYLLGGFNNPDAHDHGKDTHHTYGFLDMGGASAQIAFVPNATESHKHKDDLTFLRMRSLDGKAMDYGVYVTTWLEYGVNEARKRFVKDLTEQSAAEGVKELPDPCLPKGLKMTLDGKMIESEADAELNKVHLLGTGRFTECQSQTYPLLDKDAPCEKAPCLLKGHVPAIDFDINHFVGVSEYWHTTHDEVFGKDGAHPVAYDFATYQKNAKDFCEQDWETIEKGVAAKKWGKKVDEESIMGICFKASWIINVLHEGIGVPRIGHEMSGKEGSHNGTEELLDAAKSKGFLNPFQAVDKIDDIEVSWTLGRMVLYTASQVPPLKEGEVPGPVGFGSLAKLDGHGLPQDFQYGGPELAASATSKPLVPLPGPSNFSSDPTDIDADKHWHDALWREGDKAPRRIPGLFMFFFIFSLAAFLLMGRERRGRLFRYCCSSAKKRSRKIPGSSGTVTYERVMEDGIRSPTAFELGSIDSSGSDEEATGWDRPKIQKQGVFGGIGYSDDVPAGGAGLITRTGSRERMVQARSRDVSPSKGRMRSPLPKMR